MKSRLFVMLCSVALLSGCATTGSYESREENFAGYTKVALTVHGLSCPLCANNLDSQLEKIEGVTDISTDLKSGTVTVSLKEGHTVTSEDFVTAVKNSGFTLKGVRPVEAQ